MGADYFDLMPIYEFHCAGCERDSEVLVRSADWRGTKCPHCGSTRLAKQLSNFASAGAGNNTSASKKTGGSHRAGGCCGGHCHGGH